ncbi:CBS domain-containing protein [Actinophytocola sp.]|uniref:CBS domain-containing protein n=1 Tax=Actinophytocola sp. TaxID=1872138 RepID=UPI002D7F47B8|nr:CBS domain-containing protein [Actinophytocola sp.]HET9138308.1 CBS domain-containing protein [Actinophytocola sp.]
MRAHDVMTSPVVTVEPDTPLKAAAALLAARGFTALPVLDAEERLVGIVTEADLMRGRIPFDPRHHDPVPPAAEHATVADVMSAPVIFANPGTDLAELAATMLDSRLRSVPIVDGHRLVGIVTRRDLVRLTGRDDALIARDVRHRLEIYGGGRRWRVEVREGVVTIGDEFDDPTDRHAARRLAEAVPGVVRAEVFTMPEAERT